MTAHISSALDVTVVMPTFNRAKLVERALDSLRNQSFPATEVLVVDDGSQDGTPEVVRAWGERHQQPVRVVTMARNGGPAPARNRGIQLAKTRYVAFLDSDDEHLPTTLQTLCAGLDARPSAVLSFGDATVVTPEGNEPNGLFGPKADRSKVATRLADDLFLLNQPTDVLLPASILPTSATCFKREDALAVGGMPERFRSGEDWLFFLRMSQRGEFVFTPRDIALHHRHGDNLTSPRAGEFVAREKLAGLAALLDGTAGVTLTAAQRDRVAQMRQAQQVHWRYHLSRLGLPAYLRATRAGAMGITAAPRDVLRALAASVGLLR